MVLCTDKIAGLETNFALTLSSMCIVLVMRLRCEEITEKCDG